MKLCLREQLGTMFNVTVPPCIILTRWEVTSRGQRGMKGKLSASPPGLSEPP